MEIFHIPGPAPLFTNTFLVTDGEIAVAVDPAAAPEAYLAQLEQRGLKLTHILLTHGHHDHVGAAQALRQATGAKVFLAREDALGGRLFPFTAPDEDLADGQTLESGALRFRVYRTPGHSQGSVCFLCGDVLFSGDTLFAGDIGRTDLAGGSMADMQRSLEKLCRAIHEDVQVLPGHEEFSTLAAERRGNPYLAPYAQL